VTVNRGFSRFVWAHGWLTNLVAMPWNARVPAAACCVTTPNYRGVLRLLIAAWMATPLCFIRMLCFPFYLLSASPAELRTQLALAFCCLATTNAGICAPY
jgi:hypothetical protein